MDSKKINYDINLLYSVGEQCYWIDNGGSIHGLVLAGITISYAFGHGRYVDTRNPRNQIEKENGYPQTIEYTFLSNHGQTYRWEARDVKTKNIMKTKAEVRKYYSDWIDGLI